MVISGKGRDREAEKLMAMGPERSKPLHNFTMPCLKWGNQRFLRCMKLNSHGEASAVDRGFSASEVERGLIETRREKELEKRGSSYRTESLRASLSSPTAEVGGSGPKSKVDSDGDNGIEAVREKLMIDLQKAAYKMKDAILREGLEEQPPETVGTAPIDAEAVRPWNLRTRRAACKAPNGFIGAGSSGDGGANGGGGKSLKVDVLKPNFSALTESKSPRLRGGFGAATLAPSREKRERVKFSISLSRREVEEDFMSMMGQRPSRRPRKRPKIVQKQLDTLFPGLWLTEITADFYKVPDAPETGKR